MLCFTRKIAGRRRYVAPLSIALALSLLAVAVCGVAGPARAAGNHGWQSQTSGTRQPLYAVACLSPSRCKAVGAAGTIRYTKDGGRTWKAQRNPLAGTSAILYRISCIAPSTCDAIARPKTVIVTRNGGATWTSHTIPVPGVGANLRDASCVSRVDFQVKGREAVCRLGLLDISCINARTCYVVATSPISPTTCSSAACMTPSSVWMTKDAGATWVKQSIPPTVPCAGDCGNEQFTYPLEWVSCLSSGLCRAGGTRFVSGHAGFADAVIETSQPGAAWTLLNPNNDRFSPDAAKCPTTAHCYGVFSTSAVDAPADRVWLSADGGSIWHDVASGTNRVREDIACPRATTCYTVGDGGAITQTTDGSTFVAVSSPTTRNLYGIKCLSTATCYAVGGAGTILARR